MPTNTGDADADGIPNYADGFMFTAQSLDIQLPADQQATADAVIRGPGEQVFTPVFCPLNSSVTLDYYASDPSSVTSTFTQDGITFNVPGTWTESRPIESSGKYRVWTKPGNEVRDPRSVLEGGDYVPPGITIAPGQLGSTPSFYIEAISPTMGESSDFLRYRWSTPGAGCQYMTVPISAYETRFVSFQKIFGDTRGQDTVTYIPSSFPTLSYPAPKVTMDWTVQNLRLSDDHRHVLADLVINANVRDLASDLIAGPDGMITSGKLLLNDEYILAPNSDTPIDFPFNHSTKATERTSDPTAPYPFEGIANGHIVRDVQLIPGMNTLELQVQSPYGSLGGSSMSLPVLVDLPAVSVSVQLQTSTPTTGTMTVASSYVNGHGSTINPAQFTEVATYTSFLPDPANPTSGPVGVWTTASGHTLQVFSPDEVDNTVPALLSVAGLCDDFSVQLTSSGTPTLLTGSETLHGNDHEDLRFASLSIGEPTQPTGYDGNDNSGMLIEYVGPTQIINSDTRVTVNGPEHEYQITHTLLPGEQMPRHLLMNKDAAAATSQAAKTPAIFIKMKNLRRLVNNPNLINEKHLPYLLTADYWYGYGYGLLKGGVFSLWEGPIDTFKLIGDMLGSEHSTISIGYRIYYNGLRATFNEELAFTKELITDTLRLSRAIGSFNRQQGQVLYALVTGDTSFLTPDMVEVVDTTHTIVDELIGMYIEMEPGELGKLHGEIAGQVVQFIVMEAITAGGATAAYVNTAVSKSAVLTRVVAELRKPIELGGRLAAMKTALGANRIAALATRVEQRVQKLVSVNTCFVAGTLVHTSTGLVPIESVRVGDTVLSLDQRTGEVAYNRVIDTIVTHPSSLMTISWLADDGAAETVTGTPEHPFWVDQRQDFVPMGKLRVGDVLTTSNNRCARVIDVTAPRGPPAGLGDDACLNSDVEEFVTYNFEVESAHTYFVGESGVLVHNAGNLCVRLAEYFLEMKRLDGLEGIPALRQFLQNTSTQLQRLAVDSHLRLVIREVMDDVFRLARLPDGRIDLSKVPKVSELKALVQQTGRLAKAKIEVHHIVPEYVLKRLIAIKGKAHGWTTDYQTILFNQLVDDMPGYLVHQIDHTRRVAGSAADPAGNGIMAIHRIMNKGELKGGVGLSPSAVKQIKNADKIGEKLSDSYGLWDRPELAEAAMAWLRKPGVELLP